METNRLTWKEIQEQYPDQWLGLIDVEYELDSHASIKTAVVGYVGRQKSELTKMMLRGECVSRYTTPDNVFQLGTIVI